MVSVAIADESWTEFRGPAGEGISSDRDLPLTWSESENLRWKLALPGKGWSSPVVRGDRIWLTTATEEGKSLRVCCVDFASGELLLDQEVFRQDQPPAINGKNSYASPTPVLDEDRVFVHFGTFGTACLDTRDGTVLWRNRELILDHKEGPGSSPIGWKDRIFVNLDGVDVQHVAALDKRTGEVLWKTARSGAKNPTPDFRKAYATPTMATIDGVEQLISTGADRAGGYDPLDGREIWSVDYQGFSNVPRPILGNGIAFLCTGYMKPQLWAIRLTSDSGEAPLAQDVTATRVLWKNVKNVPANPTPILLGDHIYMVSDQGVATCLDVGTGKEHWQKRLEGAYSASPICAAGRIYFLNEAGLTTVLQAGEKTEILAKNQLQGVTQATPAIFDKSILLRTDTHLYRIATQ